MFVNHSKNTFLPYENILRKHAFTFSCVEADLLHTELETWPHGHPHREVATK